MNRRLLFLLPWLLLAACDKDKDVDPPAQLVDFTPKIRVEKVWSIGLGSDAKQLRLGLRPASDGALLFAASADGEVVGLDPNTGRTQWRVKSKLPLSGGPATGGGKVVVGSSKGDVLALSAADGAQLWQVRIKGELLSAPAVTDKLVVIRTVDGRLRALDAADGHEVWVAEQIVPRLTLRGTAPPVVAGDLVLCGFDNGKVLAVNLADGETEWEAAVTPPRGRTELDRLVDIDSPVRVVDKDVYVVGFQGRAAMLALESGQIWWARDASSERGLAIGGDSIFIAGANGDVLALRRRDGAPLWQQAALHRRGLTAPAVDGPTIVLADFEGYVHWLDAASGEPLARMRTDGDRVTNAPLVAAGMVFVLTDSGTLAAFRRIEDAPAPSG